MNLIPTRAAGLAALKGFVTKAAHHYTAQRNFDYGPDDRSNISLLSPYIRHRLITEQEVVAAVLGSHSFAAAEKFIQEVFWRTYWKGWLEMRPGVWDGYVRDVASLLDTVGPEYNHAIAGETGIACFDAWVRELTEIGYLHNHARMWFASIWIFTLQLPWQLGADFFYRHLLDGDPASNTLSWRWVAGLQTAGKTYLAQADNIAKFTGGRFKPAPLTHHAGPPSEAAVEPLPLVDLPPIPDGPVGMLLTQEDLNPESIHWRGAKITAIASMPAYERTLSPMVSAFKAGAFDDAHLRCTAQYTAPVHAFETWDAGPLIAWAREHGVTAIVTPYLPIGHAQSHVADLTHALATQGVALIQVRRKWDSNAWPHARKGFFAFKEHIPALIRT